MNKKIISILAVVSLLTSLVACGSETSENLTSTSVDNSKLTVGAYYFPVVLEPSTDWVSWQIVESGSGETLMRYGTNGEVLPWLAEGLEVDSDGLTWTIKLREDVVFSNGVQMTATKVKESLDRLFYLEDPANGGNGNPYSHFSYDSLEADDENFTVTMVTSVPTPDLPGCLAYPWTLIVDAEASAELDTKLQGTITTGPYVVQEFIPGTSIKSVRNENYWNGTVGFDEIEYIAVKESSMRAMSIMD